MDHHVLHIGELLLHAVLGGDKEAEIDFSEIEWMGQGFVHQLFVVFQNEHPQLRLVPSNMTQPVEKMYKHVMYES